VWFAVLSGGPQGSVLSPLLFLLFVIDFPDWITSSIKMFADGTKMWKIIKVEEDKETLQFDLDKLMEWSDISLFKFNQEKYRVMFVGEDTKLECKLTNEVGSHSLK